MNTKIKAGLYTAGFVVATFLGALIVAALNEFVWVHSGFVLGTTVLIYCIYNIALGLLASNEEIKKWAEK